MIREPNVKKQLRKSQEIMEQSTTKKPQNAYYDDGVVFTGRQSLPLNNRLDSQRESQAGSRGASTNRQAVIDYIRNQEARMADAGDQSNAGGQ